MILVTGASGKLGAYLVAELRSQGRPVAAWSCRQQGQVADVPLQQVDLCNLIELEKAYRALDPAAVIHCAALSAVGDCYRNPEKADLINHQATALLARLAKRLVYTSTDLVFDGKSAPYSEEATPNPLSVYGRSKLAGERAILDLGNALVVRLSLLYGPAGPGFQGGFFQQQMEALEQGEILRLFTDEWRTVLALDDAARGLVRALDSDSGGVAHLGGPERLSRYDMGRHLAHAYYNSSDLVVASSQSEVDFGEPRPQDVSLSCERAKREWGWNPSGFADGLTRLIGSPGPSSTKR